MWREDSSAETDTDTGPSPPQTLALSAEMNRHHYALYVHNCRLVFLLRKDFDQADTFRPAEFHWKLDQVWLAPGPSPLLIPLQGWAVCSSDDGSG